MEFEEIRYDKPDRAFQRWQWIQLLQEACLMFSNFSFYIPMKPIASYLVHSSKEPEVYLIRLLKRLFGVFLKRERLCHVALAGGKTPLDLYKALSRERLLWERLRFYLSDEKYVPLSSELSNYKNIKQALGERPKVAFFKTDMPPEECAIDYSLQLPERLHIALLGVGRDGHTASLFPGVECQDVSPKVCLSSSPDGLLRFSLKEDYLNSSCVIIFFLKDEDKKEAFEALLKGGDIPASRVKGKLRTYIFTNLHLPSIYS